MEGDTVVTYPLPCNNFPHLVVPGTTSNRHHQSEVPHNRSSSDDMANTSIHPTTSPSSSYEWFVGADQFGPFTDLLLVNNTAAYSNTYNSSGGQGPLTYVEDMSYYNNTPINRAYPDVPGTAVRPTGASGRSELENMSFARSDESGMFGLLGALVPPTGGSVSTSGFGIDEDAALLSGLWSSGESYYFDDYFQTPGSSPSPCSGELDISDFFVESSLTMSTNNVGGQRSSSSRPTTAPSPPTSMGNVPPVGFAFSTTVQKNGPAAAVTLVNPNNSSSLKKTSSAAPLEVHPAVPQQRSQAVARENTATVTTPGFVLSTNPTPPAGESSFKCCSPSGETHKNNCNTTEHNNSGLLTIPKQSDGKSTKRKRARKSRKQKITEVLSMILMIIEQLIPEAPADSEYLCRLNMMHNVVRESEKCIINPQCDSSLSDTEVLSESLRTLNKLLSESEPPTTKDSTPSLAATLHPALKEAFLTLESVCLLDVSKKQKNLGESNTVVVNLDENQKNVATS